MPMWQNAEIDVMGLVVGVYSKGSGGCVAVGCCCHGGHKGRQQLKVETQGPRRTIEGSVS